jgi:hypothetical protein
VSRSGGARRLSSARAVVGVPVRSGSEGEEMRRSASSVPGASSVAVAERHDADEPALPVDHRHAADLALAHMAQHVLGVVVL